ncbi:MAG TPA: bifunctional glutamate N-acetyltransferase/amino-acid acetyltransferase ArgJ [Actinomycetota bacterium]|nr:bifunctional glutamate N-acetyltransferase/amino-acid acetyltransferase ArgJ [Actinomycetota bacterium]
MSVTFPLGFRAAGIEAGLKPSGNPDLALLVADGPATAAGLFTTNAFAAWPVLLCRERLADGSARAVLVNSGQANAGTGPEGEADAVAATGALAELLALDEHEVLSCSTGVIGERIHMDHLLAGLPELVGGLSIDGGDAFARAIMTTDTVDKQAQAERAGYRVGGAAKGVGMISPDLATMLVFLTTDAPVPPAALHELALSTLEEPFESLTVDASSSTNDTVLLLSSGAAGGDPVTPGSSAWSDLCAAVTEVTESLVSQLAHDAEGVTHVLLIDVEGAPTTADARVVAKAVADSPLVKTAAFGGDPNPGRILQAIGSSGATFVPGDVRAWIGDVLVIDGGHIARPYFDGDGEAARTAMKESDIRVRVSLGDGRGRSRAVGCDLSYEYVRINGEYTT